MNKGISCIGVLIIFIAMILVAAVAAMVLLQTVGSLEGQALQTGKESTGEVSTKLRITSITGVTNNATDPYALEYLRIIARLAPGSSNIDLNNTLMTISTKGLHAQGISYNMSVPENTVTDAKAASYLNVSYSIVYLGQPASYSNSSRLSVKQNDIVEFWYRVGEQATNASGTRSALNTNISGGILPSTDVTVTLTPQHGATEEIPFRTPPSYEGQYVALFP